MSMLDINGIMKLVNAKLQYYSPHFAASFSAYILDVLTNKCPSKYIYVGADLETYQ